MLEELSTQQERESDDDGALDETTHEDKKHEDKRRDRPRSAELRPLTRKRRLQSQLRSQARDDKRAALSGTY